MAQPTGEKNLHQLLKAMKPALLDGNYAFVTVPPGRAAPTNVTPLATCAEPEGLSLILSEADTAKAGLPHAFFCRCISISVHSSLYAVGFLAVLAARLAKEHMSINIVSAYHRDYIFVPTNRAQEAMAALERLVAEATAGRTDFP